MAHEALELPHQPSPERLIDISQEWAQSRTRVPSVVSDPTPKEWIELTGDVGHRHMGSSSDVQVPNRRLHRLQRRRADRRKKITEHLGGPRVFCATGPKAIPEEVKADVRIVASSVAVFAVSDFAFGGMHLQPALR